LRLLVAVNARATSNSSSSSSSSVGSSAAGIDYILAQLDAATRSQVTRTKLLSRSGLVVLGLSSSEALNGALRTLRAAPGERYWSS
jgi:hypothetical protein